MKTQPIDFPIPDGELGDCVTQILEDDFFWDDVEQAIANGECEDTVKDVGQLVINRLDVLWPNIPNTGLLESWVK